MLVDQGVCQVVQFFIRVAERIRLRVLLKGVFGPRVFEMLQRHPAVETKFRCRAIEGRHRHGVIKHIVEPAKANGAGCDLQAGAKRSEEHTSELQSPCNLVCRLLLEKKKRQGGPAGPQRCWARDEFSTARGHWR